MAFQLDFNSIQAEQRVESLISKLKVMGDEATKASAKLIPPKGAVQQMKEMADSQASVTKALKEASAESDKTAKALQKDTKDSKSGIERFFKSLDKSLTDNANKVNAWRGTYGQATQEMMKANESLKKNASDLAKAEQSVNAARIAQAKLLNTQLVAEERASMAKRTQDWTEYYRKQETQVSRYRSFLKQSQDTWATTAIAKQRSTAQEMARIAQQSMREEVESLNRRSSAWKEYYAKQDAQVARYRSSIDQSRTIVARASAANAKSMRDTTSSLQAANQATSSFRAGISALGMGFGIYTSSTILAATATYAFISAVQHTLSIGSQFEKSMYRVYAVTSQMGTTFEKNGNLYVETSDRIKVSQQALEDAAIKASKATIFTAVESAEGLVALGMAGLSAEKAIGALTPSLQLAQIGMIDVYESADIMTNVMLGFGMSIDTTQESLRSATLVTDVLAAAITNSNSTIKEMSRSLSYVAPIANAAGGSIQETVAALETFHNVGIKGQRAGTSLRRAYVNLLEPTDQVASKLRDLGVSVRDAEGEMRTLTDIMISLKEAGASTADLVTVFGVRAAPAMIAFMSNLADVVAETNRLKTSVDGAGKAMADFMATSTSGQWQIINSKIQAQFIDAFNQAEPAVKRLNYELMDLSENKLDGAFDFISRSIYNTADAAAIAVKHLGNLIELYGMYQDYQREGYYMLMPFARPDEQKQPTTSDFGSFGSTMGTQSPLRPDPTTEGFANWQKNAPEMFSSFTTNSDKLNDSLSKGVLLTEEQVAERVRQEEASKRLIEFAKMENDLLRDTSFTVSATSAKRDADIKNETLKYQEKLGLISYEESMQQQLSNLEAAKLKITERYNEETAKYQTQLDKIRATNTGMAADGKAYSDVLKEQAKLNDQHKGQLEQINAELVKTKLSIQESAMKKNGYATLTKEAATFTDTLTAANQKLQGNKDATYENTLANIQNAVARRQAWQATSEFMSLSEDQRAAFVKETDAINAQIPAWQALIDKNKELRESASAEKAYQKVSREFGRGKGMSDEAKGIAEYKEALNTYQEYLANKDQLMQEYGLSELEFNQMIVDSKMEAEQKFWDSQHEHLAAFRDDWSTTIADQLESYIFMEQSWKETMQNMSRQMLGTMINAFIKVGAEMAANHIMRMMFSSQEMAMDSTVAANKVATEGVKQAASTATAATEAAANAKGIAYFTEMLGMGPALAAAWAPAAMYINIASFGSAALAASATMAIAGAVSAAAGIVAGAGGGAGSVIGGAGDAITGARAAGGDVMAGKSYLVGENGREVFTPDTNGSIMNNQELMNMSSGGSGAVEINFHNMYQIDATGNEQIEERLERALEEAGNIGHQKVVEDLMGNGNVAKLVKQASRS